MVIRTENSSLKWHKLQWCLIIPIYFILFHEIKEKSSIRLHKDLFVEKKVDINACIHCFELEAELSTKNYSFNSTVDICNDCNRKSYFGQCCPKAQLALWTKPLVYLTFLPLLPLQAQMRALDSHSVEYKSTCVQVLYTRVINSRCNSSWTTVKWKIEV